MIAPARISTIRSAMRIASSGSCVTTMVVAPGLPQDRDGLVADGVAHAPVEVGERLVHQQHAGARRDGARERDALLLAAGQGVRIFVGVVARGRRGTGRARAATPASRGGQVLQAEHEFCRIVMCGNRA